jgi:hypothetical protein
MGHRTQHVLNGVDALMDENFRHFFFAMGSASGWGDGGRLVGESGFGVATIFSGIGLHGLVLEMGRVR